MTRKRIQIAVLALLVLVAFWVFREGFGGAGAAGPVRARSQKAEPEPLPEVPVVQLGSLEGDEVPYDPQGRNLFRYTEPPPSAEELAQIAEAKRRADEARKRAAEEAERRRKAAELAADAARKAQEEANQRGGTAVSVPQPPEIRLNYVGYVGPRDGRVAVLLDPDGNIVVGKEGEVVQEEFRILRIGYSYLEMGYVDFEGSKPLPLNGGGQG